MKDRKIVIIVYMEDGRRFRYHVINYMKAREHAHRIINYGWRNGEDGNLVYYPIHQINKVVIIGGEEEAYSEYLVGDVK